MKKSEREAAARAEEILARHRGGRGDIGGANSDGYGSGRLTKAQKKSQEQHIGWTRGPDTTAKKIARKLWG